MKDEIVELQVYIFTWLCIYFCMFFFVFLSVQFELGGVAVVHCLPKREKKKKKKKHVACPSLQTFQGRLN